MFDPNNIKLETAQYIPLSALKMSEDGTRDPDNDQVEVTQIFTGGKSFWRTGKTLDIVM